MPGSRALPTGGKKLAQEQAAAMARMIHTGKSLLTRLRPGFC